MAREKRSAGLLVFREAPAGVEVLLVHPGGPFWANKDEGAWSIPKGEVEEGEDPAAAARREFHEETGFAAPPHRDVELIPLEPVRQRGGKVVHAFAMRGDFDPAAFRSNRFAMEWPPKSGRIQEFPEVDRAAWFGLGEGARKILPAQAGLLAQLGEMLRRS